MGIPMSSKAHQRYTRTMVLASAAYIGTLFPAITFIDRVPAGPWRYLVALLPAVPCFWMLWAVIRLMREVDEMWRRIYLEAATFSLGLTIAASITWFFLVRLADAPRMDLIWVASFAFAMWGLGAYLARRRYGACTRDE